MKPEEKKKLALEYTLLIIKEKQGKGLRSDQILRMKTIEKYLGLSQQEILAEAESHTLQS